MLKNLLQRIALLVFFLPFLAHAGGEALFGLTFGMTVDQVKEVSSTLKFERNVGVLAWHTATNMPKELSNVETYTLGFAEDKLVKVGAIFTTIKADLYGSEGKKNFDDLRSALIQKYGPPSQDYQRVGMKLFKESDEFYQCLKYDGCGVWLSIFKVDGKSIMVSLTGIGRGVGSISLIAESNPEFENAKNKKNMQIKNEVKEAL